MNTADDLKKAIGLADGMTPETELVYLRATKNDADRLTVVEAVFSDVQAICNRHKGNTVATEISALLTRKVW